MAIDLDGKRLKPGINHERGGRWRVIPTTAMSRYSIVTATGSSNGYLKVTKADADAAVSSRSTLFMCRHAVAAAEAGNPNLEVCTRMIMLGDAAGAVDTSAGTVGDPVYLSGTAGGWTLTASLSTAQRIIGRVLVVSATVGAILFDGSIASGRLTLSGTAVILNTATTVAVTVGADYNGKPALACFNEADGTLYILSAIVAAGVLTITCSAGTTGDRDVGWVIFGG